MEGIEPTTPRLQITCSGQLSYIGIVFRLLRKSLSNWDCKDRYIFHSCKTFPSFFNIFTDYPLSVQQWLLDGMRLRDMFCGNLCHERTETLTRNYLSASKISDRRFPSAGEAPVV